jgi:hypothetical protein
MTRWIDIPKDVRDKILKARNALIVEDLDAAYHWLYAIADPTFTDFNPWKEEAWDSKMKIYLDDVRKAPEGWIGVTTAHEAYNWICKGIVSHISLDHDLGEKVASGYDLTKWITRDFFEKKLKASQIPEFSFHSMNPVGRENMIRQVESLKKLMEQRECGE